MTEQEPTALDEILRRLARIEARIERIETRVDAIPILLPSVRDRLAIIDAQLHSQGAALGRLEDTLSMDLMQRIRKLERRDG